MVIILEGPDNTGKGTQIKKLQPLLTDKPLHVMHYMAIKGLGMDEIKDYSREMYTQMFAITRMWYDKTNFLLDRAHIGETVYSPMYRNYNGDYVFDIEQKFASQDPDFWNQVILITFIDKPENLISRDDGLSFTVQKDKKQNEIDAFIRGTEMSNIKHKLVLNIDGKDEDTVFDETKTFLKSI